jgi:hypothetical protein
MYIKVYYSVNILYYAVKVYVVLNPYVYIIPNNIKKRFKIFYQEFHEYKEKKKY